MSQVEQFATKYRSKTVEEYIGNDYVKSTMLRQFSEEPFPQTVMLIGESGCGKTTMARLLAKHIVCENPVIVEKEGIIERLPCNECQVCKAMDNFIEDGDSENIFNVTELDSSVSRRAESIDEFISNASVPSMYGGYEVYIIDECHMISKTGQTSFLKFLEDVPEGKIFIFCTTDRDKVLDTLVNRCKLLLEVRKPSLDNIVQNLQRIADVEGISYELGALKLIAERSSYVYRSSINNFEAVYRGYKTVTVENTAKALDIQTLDLFFDFFRHLVTGNTVMYSHVLHQIKVGAGFAKFFENLQDFVKRGIYVKNGVPVDGMTASELKQFKNLFDKFSLEEVYVLLDFLSKAKEGDLETNLFLLGYRGLSISPAVAQNVSDVPVSEIKTSEEDLSRERQVQEVFREHQIEVKRETTNSSAEEDLKDFDTDAMAELFGLG